jgi:hypothetical protein
MRLNRQVVVALNTERANCRIVADETLNLPLCLI